MGTPRQRAVADWAKASYGIVLSEAGPIVVRASRQGSGLRYETLGSDDITSLTAESRTEVVAGCLSERESFARWLTAPFPSVHKALQVFPSLLDIQLPFPIEDCVHDFMAPSVTVEQTTRALAVAARLSDVEKKLAAYSAIQADPIILDQEGIALWSQSNDEKPIQEGVTRAVAHLEGDRITLSLGKRDEFIGAHNISASPDQIGRVLRSAAVTEMSALEWAWTGPAADKERVDAIADGFGQDWAGKSFIHDDPAVFLARAIAARAITPGPIRCNLRGGQHEHAELRTRAMTRSRKAAVISLAAGILLCVLSIALGRLSDARVTDASRVFIDLAEDMVGGSLGGKRGKDALERVDKAVRKEIQLSRPFTAAFEPSLTVALKEMTDTGAGGKLAYSFVMLRDGSVTIMGTAKTREACEALVSSLKSKLGISLSLHSRESSTGGDIQFSIKPGGPRG